MNKQMQIVFGTEGWINFVFHVLSSPTAIVDEYVSKSEATGGQILLLTELFSLGS